MKRELKCDEKHEENLKNNKGKNLENERIESAG